VHHLGTERVLLQVLMNRTVMYFDLSTIVQNDTLHDKAMTSFLEGVSH